VLPIFDAQANNNSLKPLIPGGFIFQLLPAKLTAINAQGKTIQTLLYIDDDDDDRALFRMAIAAIDTNIECILLDSAQEGLDLIIHGTVNPDLILIDLNIPKFNGFDFLAAFAKQRSIQAPVMMLSTSASPHDINRALSLGAVDFITKPSSYPQLCNLLRDRVLGSSHISLS
jgi:CheY-like chemotaxis protein